MKKIAVQKKLNRGNYLAVISFVALSFVALSCGAASAQTNDLAATNSISSATNSISPATNSVASSENSTNVANLGNITVIGQLDQARSQILPNLGATAYTHTAEQIESQSQGGDAPMNQVILRSPGVAGDNEASDGLHIRGEHANLQYRIDDVLLPEGIAGFGFELDPRFIDSMQLITGSLPAQYGFRTAGVIDIQTKSGFENGGEAEIYGGSFDTFRPSFEFGGTQDKWNYFVDGSYDHNGLGIENPTDSHNAIHDDTDQYKGFVYASRILSDTSRLTFMGSASDSFFQIPDTAGLPAGTAPGLGNPTWGSEMTAPNSNSANLNENQNEQNYYGVVSYQKSAGNLNYQVSAIARNSDVHFTPDMNGNTNSSGDLYFNGVASDLEKKLYSGGLQADASYELNDKHTIRFGLMALDESVDADSTTAVFPMGSNNPSSPAFDPTGPATNIVDNSTLHGLFAGVYLQDEWKILESLTANFGARFDEFYSTFDKENQVSPRVNLIWQPTDSTTLHAGYSRYFTPPPVEDVSGATVNKFDGTSNESPGGPNAPDSPVKAERANYFDVGASQKIGDHLQVGVDSYYKTAQQQLDDGLFGQTLVLSAFNYAKGEVYGTEVTASYNNGGFSSYANIAYSVAKGEDWDSAQFLFNPNDVAYVKNHWIYLDHDQTVSGSFGIDYTWKENHDRSTRVYADAIYGSGLRTTVNTPNDSTVPAYYSINCGAEQSWKIDKDKTLKARVDVVNLTDNIYELRDGSGVGVNAASYGERLGFFGSLSLTF